MAIVCGIIFAGSIVRSTLGFGEALIAMPLLVFVIPPQMASPLVAVVSSFNAILILSREWRQISFRVDRYSCRYLGAECGQRIGREASTGSGRDQFFRVVTFLPDSCPDTSRTMGAGFRDRRRNSGRRLQHLRAATCHLRDAAPLAGRTLSREPAKLLSAGRHDHSGDAYVTRLDRRNRASPGRSVFTRHDHCCRHRASVDPIHLDGAVYPSGSCLPVAGRNAAARYGGDRFLTQARSNPCVDTKNARLQKQVGRR